MLIPKLYLIMGRLQLRRMHSFVSEESQCLCVNKHERVMIH